MVWFVTDGDYSDYHIEGVFSSRESAEKAIEAGAVQGEIDSWELDEWMTTKDYVEAGWRVYNVGFKPNGDIDQNSWSDGPAVDHSGKHGAFHSDMRRGDWHGYYHGTGAHPQSRRGSCRITLWAKDKDMAIKVAAERRRELILQADLEGKRDWFTVNRNSGEEEWC
jgi:hypothetical protein